MDKEFKTDLTVSFSSIWDLLPLHNMGVGEILDKSIWIYRQNFRTLCGISFIAHIPYIFFLVLYGVIAFYETRDRTLVIFLSFCMLIFLFVWIFMLTAIQASSIYLVSNVLFKGKGTGIVSSFKILFSYENNRGGFFSFLKLKIVKLTVILFIYTIILIFLFIPVLLFFYITRFIPKNEALFFSIVIMTICIIFIIIIFTLLMFVYNILVPVITLEEKGYFSSIIRAVHLIIKDPLKTILVPFLLGMMVQLLQGAIAVPFVVIALIFFQYDIIYIGAQLFSQISSVILFPLVFVGNGLIYYSVLFQKEGYDLELMLEDISSEKIL